VRPSRKNVARKSVKNAARAHLHPATIARAPALQRVRVPWFI
jgi:hypothetical protein